MPKKLKTIIGTGIVMLALNGNNLANNAQAETHSINDFDKVKISNTTKALYYGGYIGISFLTILGIDKYLTNKYGKN